MSHRRVEIAFSDFGELLRILAKLCFVAIQHLAKGWTGAFISNDAIPFLIPCKLGKDFGKMMQQFGTLRGRQGPDRIFNLLRGAHSPILAVYVQAATGRQFQECDVWRVTCEVLGNQGAGGLRAKAPLEPRALDRKAEHALYGIDIVWRRTPNGDQ